MVPLYRPPDRKPGITLQILYQDPDILAVHKPVGVLSQKAKKDDYSINEAIVDYCFHADSNREAVGNVSPVDQQPLGPEYLRHYPRRNLVEGQSDVSPHIKGTYL